MTEKHVDTLVSLQQPKSESHVFKCESAKNFNAEDERGLAGTLPTTLSHVIKSQFEVTVGSTRACVLPVPANSGLHPEKVASLSQGEKTSVILTAVDQFRAANQPNVRVFGWWEEARRTFIHVNAPGKETLVFGRWLGKLSVCRTGFNRTSTGCRYALWSLKELLSKPVRSHLNNIVHREKALGGIFVTLIL